MTAIRIGSAALDAVELASQGNGILGIRDSGKSYTAAFLAERLMDAGIPIIAFDPIGIWRFLRVAGVGKGYPVVVAGGEHGDLPLTAHNAAEIVRAAMREGVSLVLDLYSIELSKADWKRIVQSAVKTLLHGNKEFGLRHIFIEEAAEFAPQRIGPGDGMVYAEIEKLARMGGNALLGYTLINQRAEEVNKAILELCDTLFLHRQKGRNSITALSKWLDIAGAVGAKEIVPSLPLLEQGECWLWRSGSDTPVRVKIPAKRSFHPDRRAMRDAPALAARAAVNVSAFVDQMKAALPVLAKEADDKDPKKLLAKIAMLEAQLRKSSTGATPGQLATARQEGHDGGLKQGRLEGADEIRKLRAAILAAAGYLTPLIEAKDGGVPVIPVRHAAEPVTIAVPPRPQRQITISPPSRGRDDNAALAPAERKFLTVLAQRGSLTRNKIAIFAGYSVKSGHVDNTLGGLRTRRLAAGGNDAVSITENGRAALGDFDPLPTGNALQSHWLSQLDKAGAAFLRILIDVYPRPITRDEIAAIAGYSPSSGHVDNTLGRIRTLELAVGRNDAIYANPDLFE
ncbi:MAG: hypothetical protein ACREFC_15300 [Stellaceae bacterium]